MPPLFTLASTRRGFVSGPCAWCGDHFTFDLRVTGNPPVYCSTYCAKKRGKAGRSGRFQPSLKLRLSIYERDGWICQLCMEPIDQSAHFLSDWAPSLDHVECQSWALVPDHSPENLRTAHRWCNAVRGDESRYTEADFRVSA
jgi:hypothetical protein